MLNYNQSDISKEWRWSTAVNTSASIQGRFIPYKMKSLVTFQWKHINILGMGVWGNQWLWVTYRDVPQWLIHLKYEHPLHGNLYFELGSTRPQNRCFTWGLDSLSVLAHQKFIFWLETKVTVQCIMFLTIVNISYIWKPICCSNHFRIWYCSHFVALILFLVLSCDM